MIGLRLSARMARALASLDPEDRESLDPVALEAAGEAKRSTLFELDPDAATRLMVAASFAVLDGHPEARVLDAVARAIEDAMGKT